MNNEKKDFEAYFLVKRDIDAYDEEEAMQLARSMGGSNFVDSSSMKHFDYEGVIVEPKEDDEDG